MIIHLPIPYSLYVAKKPFIHSLKNGNAICPPKKKYSERKAFVIITRVSAEMVRILVLSETAVDCVRMTPLARVAMVRGRRRCAG